MLSSLDLAQVIVAILEALDFNKSALLELPHLQVLQEACLAER